MECTQKGHHFETTPDRLNHYFKNGCEICAREARSEKQKIISHEEFLQQAKDKFPYFDYTESVYQGALQPFEFTCPIHGKQTRLAADFIRRDYGCPQCGKEQIGYAGYRIQRLQSGDPAVKSRPTRIAPMKMNIWGIETYKLGVTTRTLEQRYRESLERSILRQCLTSLMR